MVTAKDPLDRITKNPSESPSPEPDDLSLDLNLAAEHNSLLNSTLKRKFTELEDITKRLKARLIDVTDEADFSDINDEFDNELNTLPGEEDVDDDFDWLEAGTSQGAIINGGARTPLSDKKDSVVELNKTDAKNVDDST